MRADDVPRGKTLFYENGKAFYYDRGHRIYVEGVEIPATAQSEPTDAKCDRVIRTCSKCGSWYDSPIGFGPVACADPETYIGEFFAKFHLKSCGSGAAVSPYRSSVRPNRPPGALWNPTSCPDFIPHSEAYVQHGADLNQRLIGSWLRKHVCMLFFGGAGGGIFLDWTKANPQFAFKWQINTAGRLALEAEERVIETDGSQHLVGEFRFELVTFTEPYGKPKDYLLLWLLSDEDPIAFEVENAASSKEPEWEIGRLSDEAKIARLNVSYLEGLFRRAHEVRIMSYGQMNSVRLANELRASTDPVSSYIKSKPLLKSVDEALDVAALGGNLWVRLVGVVPGVVPGFFSHLKLAQGQHLACLFSDFSRDSDTISGSTRIIMAESNQAGSSEVPPSELRNANLEGPPPAGLPSWVTWRPCDLIADDGTPVAVFERFLLEHWMTELLTPGSGVFYEGVVAGNECCLFLDSKLPLPEKFSFSGDIRPMIAFVSSANVSAAFLPNNEDGQKAIGSDEFTYLAFYSCRREVEDFTPPLPGEKIGLTRRMRVWYRAGKRICLETDREVQSDFCDFL